MIQHFQHIIPTTFIMEGGLVIFRVKKQKRGETEKYDEEKYWIV